MYDMYGTVKKICETQTFPSGFAKRDLVIEEEKDGKWPNIVAFTFKKDAVSKLDDLKVGDRVKITFAVDGREWTDPRTQNVRYFTDLTALRVELQTANPFQGPDGAPPAAPGPSFMPPPPAPSFPSAFPSDAPSVDDEDLPF